jgi:hypothetical protein
MRTLLILLFGAGIMIPTGAYASTYDDDVLTLISDGDNRAAAAAHLQGGGSAAFTALVGGLNGADRSGTIKITRMIREVHSANPGVIAGESDVAALTLRARKATDRSSRAHIIYALPDLGGPLALEELQRFAREDPDDGIRSRAIDLAAQVGCHDVHFFTVMAGDKSRWVRLVAYIHLASLGDPSGRDLALETLRDSAPNHERRLAIAILGTAGRFKDIAVLNTIAKAPNEDYTTKLVAKQQAKELLLHQVVSARTVSALESPLYAVDRAIHGWALGQPLLMMLFWLLPLFVGLGFLLAPLLVCAMLALVVDTPLRVDRKNARTVALYSLGLHLLLATWRYWIPGPLQRDAIPVLLAFLLPFCAALKAGNLTTAMVYGAWPELLSYVCTAFALKFNRISGDAGLGFALSFGFIAAFFIAAFLGASIGYFFKWLTTPLVGGKAANVGSS